jgi:hypothetical protein
MRAPDPNNTIHPDDFEDAILVYGEVCEVCDGTGSYPIKNIFGEVLYLIDCPECGGEP